MARAVGLVDAGIPVRRRSASSARSLRSALAEDMGGVAGLMAPSSLTSVMLLYSPRKHSRGWARG